jgi:hypothetical protein
LTPKPVYAMCATMTAMLDGAAFSKLLDTGSRSLYALEFKRTTGYVYPVWTLRGRRLMTIEVGDAAVSVTDGMGNTTHVVPAGGRVTLLVGQAPAYLSTTAPITGAVTPAAPIFDERPIGADLRSGSPACTPLGTLIAWLEHYGLINHHVVDDTVDVDHDGQTAAQEFVAGTDPTHADSAFRVIAQGLAGGSNFIVFLGSSHFGSPAAPFRMHCRANLLEGAWQLLDDNIPRAPSGTNTWWHREGPGGSGFFRPEATR